MPPQSTSKTAIRFCPPSPVWGSQRTFAEEFLPRLLENLPGSTVYSSLPENPIAGSTWLRATNALYRPGPFRRISAILRYQTTFEQQLLDAGTEVLFCPFHNEGLAFPRKIRQVLIVHDVVPLLFPRDYVVSRLLWSTLYSAAIRNSAHIICVSEATRTDLVQRLGLEPNRVSVVHNGFSAPLRPSDGKRLPRILYVASAHSTHKNIPNLVRAYAGSTLRQTHELRIVGVSHRHNTPIIRRLIERLGLGTRIHLLMQLSNEDLQEEYAKASLFVYPSLCEGFGLPLVEAMAYGIPVCASRLSAIPEIASDAALFFDPRIPSDIGRVLERLAANPDLQHQLIARGHANITRFSWTRSAAECAAICQRTLDAKTHPYPPCD